MKRMFVALAAFIALLPGYLYAQAPYPAKPVRILVGFAAGGGIDNAARFYAQKFTESMGQTFLVENRPGASGNIAAEAVSKAPPDGYTLIMVSITHAMNPSVFDKLAYDPVKDFSPISTVALNVDCIAVHPSLPVQTLKELIALARAKPKDVAYAHAGKGTMMHVGMELFLSMAKLKMLGVPYKGAAPSTAAVVGGEVPVLSTSLGPALPHARAGKLRMLAVTSAQRTPLAPEYPTVAEAANLPGYEAIVWIGLLAPADTPAAAVNKLNGEIERLVKSKEVREQLAKTANEPSYHSPTAFAELIRSDIAKWGKVIRESGARTE
ncbi:MAG: Bug family tripartite tricarboxylate transporter substrate binding protein [Betaproteobacteria bacterium]